MAKIFLHIGTHKTGTTSIQYYLNYRKKELLAQGILAPESGKASDSEFSGNHRLAWSIEKRKGETSTECWVQLADEMARFKPENVVISSEAFCKFSDQHVGQVKELLKGHETYVLVYFRNFAAYFKSIYAQVIRDSKESRSFLEFVADRPELIEYNNILMKWGGHFGYDHLVVKIYDEIKSNNMLLQDFCKTIRFVPPELDPHFNLIRNITPGEKAINAMRLINQCQVKLPFLIKDKAFIDLKEAIYNGTDKQITPKRIFMLMAKKRCYTKKSLQLITEMVENSNQELLKEMIGEERMKILMPRF